MDSKIPDLFSRNHIAATRSGGARVSAYFASSVSDFLSGDDDGVYARLTQPMGFTLTPEQLSAWKDQIPILRAALTDVEGWIYIEFDIPRLGRRVDAVLVTRTAVVPIEFKVGADSFVRPDLEQVWDYGLDLKNFHAPSHNAAVFPVLCATEAPAGDARWRAPAPDGVRPPFRCNGASLKTAIRLAMAMPAESSITPDEWGKGNYSPTPTIIEAARSLYARHTVHDITRNDAGESNLSITSERVEAIIADAQLRRRKAIVFVTGVPGAGKTLVGLNVATRHGVKEDETHAVFLSGNGPLVDVLREALAQDELKRRLATESGVRIGQCRSKVKSFIQNVHHFRDETFRNPGAPDDHVVVFDEAQRAWNAHMLGRFMKQKKNVAGVTHSEPTVLLSALDRHADWASVLCLVGGGQEINTGEAGISAWIDAVRTSFAHWDVHLSPNLHATEYCASQSILELETSRTAQSTVMFDSSLHLAASMRSFRTESLSHFVRALLDGNITEARSLHEQFDRVYPIRLTRSMKAARQWVKRHRRGSERAGLLASSFGYRLKPHAVDVRVPIDPVKWFLAPSNDTRSSQYLEDAATQFKVQGLELDWTIVAWDADLRRSDSNWTFHKFRGAKWTSVSTDEVRNYLKNAYRVLLTRARQGMVIFVPNGRRKDRTRSPDFYEGIYHYLKAAGIQEL